MDNKNIIMGLDISTTCIGVCLLEYDETTPYGKILELTHVSPKTPKNISKIESLFLKKKIFNDEFLNKWKDKGIKRVIIESPLLRSNNVNTVATLLQFNGMISDCVYNVLHIIPEFISSYDARMYSFPDLMAIRKYNKNNEMYDIKKIYTAVKKNQFVLFGGYIWDIDKKTVIQSKVSELFPDIEWLLNKKGELKKENFDACDAYVACLGFLNKEKYGELNIYSSNLLQNSNCLEYDITYWGKKEHKVIFLNDK